MIVKVTSRQQKVTPSQVFMKHFKEYIKGSVNAIFLNANCSQVIGIVGLEVDVPIMSVLLQNSKIEELVKYTVVEQSACFAKIENLFTLILEDGSIVPLSGELSAIIESTIEDIKCWAGTLNDNGEHIIDLLKPSPGPHFFVNLLIGNRLGFNRTLQTTPKSVVDRFGRGSFRSHAATQVLATRFDLRQEENGFPANRQFYLYEEGKQIFYSALVNDESIKKAICTHSCNKTIIQYETVCGLEITRTIFLIPYKTGFPMATELQRIEIVNKRDTERNLRLTYTGMFGTNTPHAVFEDVTYTNVIMQGAALYNNDGDFIGLSPDYHPQECRNDVRFVSFVVRKEDGNIFADSFSTDYNDFVGNGTLEKPAGGFCLTNKLNRKGPGFFALGTPIHLDAQDSIVIDTFTGLSSNKDNINFSEDTVCDELETLLQYYEKKEKVTETLKDIVEFQESYSQYFNFVTDNKLFDSGFNKNLAFQVLYQTFMSRSFCQTQKGYREIGFREIQDLFASMYYFINMGQEKFVKNLLFEWTANVYKMGYGNHNFYWVGKQPGLYSDDSLWLVQAYYRYIIYTKDTSILQDEVAVAEGTGETRKILDTLQAIIEYSSRISVGAHGLPLLDYADWNDCLKIDSDYVDGATKEKLYYKQLEDMKGSYGDRFISDNSESVMNAFLLKLAIDNLSVISELAGEKELEQKMTALSFEINSKIQEHAWKDDFFARVLLNRYKDGEFTYLGAKGDKLSDDENIDGTYFLNSFSWAVLSSAATDQQIKVMIDTLKKYLLTPYGIRLITPAALGRLAKDTAAGHYFFGDRENGAVFKHASMMATAALTKAAKEVKDNDLAKEMRDLAYFMVDLVLPYKNLDNPYHLAGNPRICTQYINADTGENIGPLLSGTSTWLNLTIISLAGIEYEKDGILFNPILREEEERLEYIVKAPKCSYHFVITKPIGFRRTADSLFTLLIDGEEVKSTTIPMYVDNAKHVVKLSFK